VPARQTPGPSARAPYHHGSLRRALLDAALIEIVARGPAGVSLREIARTVGVSHAAPRHHFEDKRGLLTAVATEGFALLAEALELTWNESHSFLEVGVAYVRFAIDHRAHFEVMFRPDLLRESDADLLDAQRRTRALLYGPAATVTDGEGHADPRTPAVAAWSLVHGLATLWLAGNLAHDFGDDPEALTRAVARHLF
jgi:AcrR family transcriptional regulator